jgi:adenine-specific DNA-methyltransferase
MQNLLDNLKALLQKDERLVSEGEILKNKVMELALKLDKDLIELLLSDKQMKEVFFMQVGKATIFNKDKFIKFVSNKQFLSDSYTAFKNKIGLIDEKGEFISDKKEVVLSWPYKDCVLEGGMTKEDQKRDEIFWNEILAPDEISRLLDPKVFTKAKRIDAKGEHKFDVFRTDENGNIKDNLIIKGNNLLALHSLKKRFAGKVKLIYIDPPYNREADTFYNDSFKHSSWLTFMKNRLEVARQLLKDDGVICISCDDNEQAYLKVIMDEIFGRENFVANLIRQARKGGGSMSKYVAVDHDYVMIYARNIKNLKEIFISYSEDYLKRYKEKDKKGRFFWDTFVRHRQGTANYYEIELPDGQRIKDAWIWNKEKFLKAKKEGEIRFIKKQDGSWSIQVKQRLNEEGQKLRSIITNCPNEMGTKSLKGVFGEVVFNYPKPEELIKLLLEAFTEEDDLILDFFAGTGTTATTALKMKRQFILCEQMEYIESITLERLKNVINGDQTGISKEVGWKGGGDFVYLELVKWNQNFVEKIQKAKTKQELKKLWEAMKEKAFLSYKVDVKTIDAHAKDFEDLSIEDQKRFLLECLDKNHLYVNYSEINDEEYGVNEEDKKLNKLFYEQ